MNKIVVIGGGTMGLGIGQVFANKGIDTVIRSTSDASAEKHKASLIKSLDKRIAKGKLDEAGKEALLAKLTFTSDINVAADADLVIESAKEDLALKKELFAQLDAICKPECILATNTSSISITDIASATKRADKVIGMHFFNPAPVMKLIEVIRGVNTSDETFDAVFALSDHVCKIVAHLFKHDLSARLEGFLGDFVRLLAELGQLCQELIGQSDINLRHAPPPPSWRGLLYINHGSSHLPQTLSRTVLRHIPQNPPHI